MNKIEFQILPAYQALLKSAGLNSFDALMRHKGGFVVNSETRSQTIRLELPSTSGAFTCFLKKDLAQSTGRNLRLLLRGSRPHTNAYREMQSLQNLHEHGVPAMRLMAWGEQRRWGLPLRGFILVENVPGQPLHDLFLAADNKAREKWAGAFATFVASLHTLGFYQAVRMKDLICSVNPDRASYKGSLTLIDRAAARPGRKAFSQWSCIRSLRRSLRRMARDGITFNALERTTFADHYTRAVSSHWSVSPDEIEAHLTRPRRSFGLWQGE